MMLGAKGPTLLAPLRVDDDSVPWTIRNTFIDVMEDQREQSDCFFNTAPSSCWPYSSLQADLRSTNFGSYIPSAAGTSKKENKQSSSEDEDGDLLEDGEILSNEEEEGELHEDEDSDEPEQEQSPPEAKKPRPPSGPASNRHRKSSAAHAPPPPGAPVPSKGSARHYKDRKSVV